MVEQQITSVDELVALIGVPLPRVANKVRHELHELDREWLAASPFCLVATSDETGACDVSPKGDPPGQLAYVIDDNTIALAERPGNRRADGYKNVLGNPHVGLIFLIPGRGDTLRINGRARLVSDAPFFDDMIIKGNRPILAVVVDIEEIFHHCAKAFLRSQLWRPETWGDPVPSRPVIAKILDRSDQTLEELTAYYGDQYANNLY
ncbi:MAG TPA: MSMEG_1061 family FMN-dependent PPOX-type flavoprotein [Propionibacteriaceae bacterium]